MRYSTCITPSAIAAEGVMLLYDQGECNQIKRRFVMENLFKRDYTHEELVDMIFDNRIILDEIELELITLWAELSHYSDEEWEYIGEGGKDNVREVRIDLPKLGEALTRNASFKDDAIALKKLSQIIEKMTGLRVKDLYQANDEEFEVEFLNPIPRPYIRKPVGKMLIS